MIDAVAGAFLRDFGVLVQERGQLQRLQMVRKQDLRRGGAGCGEDIRCAHAAASPFELAVIGGLRTSHSRFGQMRIGRDIEHRLAFLNAGKHDLLDRVEADGAEPDRFSRGGCDRLLTEDFHTVSKPGLFPFALSAHARLQKAAQAAEDLRQLPPLQRRSLIQSSRLAFKKGQIMQGIVDESPSS